MEYISVGWQVLSVMALVFANGFFVAAEFALVKVRATQLELLVKKGSTRAKVALNVVEHLDPYLSATQLGITLTSLGLGWLGEPVVGGLLERGLFMMGVDSPILAHQLALPVAFIIITFLHIVVGELAPKSIAILKPTDTSLWIALPLKFFYKITYPAIWLLNGSANALLRILGFRAVSEMELSHSEEELRLLVSESERHNRVSFFAKDLLINALDLRHNVARQIMIPRTQIAFFSTRKTLGENLDIAKQTQHTRFPLCDPDLDTILGLVHIKDILWLYREKGEHADLKTICRPLLFVPELVELEKLLKTMQSKRSQVAILVDEFGSTVGMLTFENIIEEIVGDIQDEFDAEKPLMQNINENEWIVDGAMALHDFSSALNIDLSGREATTVGGLVLEQLGHLPKGGEELEIDSLKIQVRNVDRMRIKQILVKRII